MVAGIQQVGNEEEECGPLTAKLSHWSAASTKLYGALCWSHVLPGAHITHISGTFTRADMLQGEPADYISAVGSTYINTCPHCKALRTGPVPIGQCCQLTLVWTEAVYLECYFKYVFLNWQIQVCTDQVFSGMEHCPITEVAFKESCENTLQPHQKALWKGSWARLQEDL